MVGGSLHFMQQSNENIIFRKSTLSTLDEVCFLLSDGRRYLMGGDQPTFVDFHFAAMAFAFALNDDLLYGGRAIDPESRYNRLELILIS